MPDAQRYDGWTPEKQKRFLTALARGHNVTKACAIVGMSRQTAYALRDSARGAAFALGWKAAQLRSRDCLADAAAVRLAAADFEQYLDLRSMIHAKAQRREEKKKGYVHAEARRFCAASRHQPPSNAPCLDAAYGYEGRWRGKVQPLRVSASPREKPSSRLSAFA